MRWHLKHAVHGDKPWDVQAEATRRCDARPRYGYFLEQGLGKTPLSLNDYYALAATGEVEACVIVSPQSFKMDWVYAPEEWGVGRQIPAGAWPHDDPAQFLRSETPLYAINYEAMRGSGGEAVRHALRGRRYMLIVDESSAIKNPKSAQTRAVMSLGQDAAFVRELNGTPLVQNVMDYFPQLKILGELDRVNPYAFRNRYAVMGGYMGKQVKKGEEGIREENRQELYDMLDRCSFRALKKDWRADLPERTTPPIHLEMHPKQRRHYDEMMQEFYTCVSGDHITAPMVLAQYEKLRQISSGLALQDGRSHWIVEPRQNPKVQALLEVAQGKTIVVHFYRATGEMLLDVLEAEGMEPARIAGGMKPEEVVREKARFNEDPACRAIVCQIEAAHRGHTLIGRPGDRASRMYFFELSFRLIHWLQMLDRNHRGDMDEPCTAWTPITSPMDQLFLDNLMCKKELADSVDAVVAAVRAWRRGR